MKKISVMMIWFRGKKIMSKINHYAGLLSSAHSKQSLRDQVNEGQDQNSNDYDKCRVHVPVEGRKLGEKENILFHCELALTGYSITESYRDIKTFTATPYHDF
mmetsp:Transcript_9171/g.11770  ORF Transcript_9171/g.11770 Transcript_9171/m.11770 type:complete len:103 (+) Transcript_9171:116-424(+)